MKKFLAGLLSLALVVAVGFSFAACGSKKGKLDGKTYEATGIKFEFKVATTTRVKEVVDGEETLVNKTVYTTEVVSLATVVETAYRYNHSIAADAELTAEQKTAIDDQIKEVMQNFKVEVDTAAYTEGEYKYLRFDGGKLYIETKTTRFRPDGTTYTETEASVMDYEVTEEGVNTILDDEIGAVRENKNALIFESSENADTLISMDDTMNCISSYTLSSLYNQYRNAKSEINYYLVNEGDKSVVYSFQKIHTVFSLVK